MKYASFLAPQIKEFIRFRTASMRWCYSYENSLHAFDSYCVKMHPNATVLSDEIVSEWCRKRPAETRNSCRARTYCVIGLVKYLNSKYGANLTEIEAPKRERRKYIPHAYTGDELKRFFAECNHPYLNADDSSAKRQNLIIPIIFRLLFSTGMRTIEARMLKRNDVRLDSGVIGITVSKGYDQRYVVMHETMLTLIIQYDSLISKIFPNRTYFFPGDNDSCIQQKWLNAVFRKLWSKISDSKCRLYDFRHNYAIQNINNWLSAGLSYHPKLVYLSKSMGHRDIEGTRYYYALVPIMAEILDQQTGASFDKLIPEVQYEKSL